ncbi:Copia protein [Senna tora]|uniref:Copia protein n=1 Tax=Senna tora TaxID=362788 RepID=A0A834X0Z0_9FABA|nr:Copia protein [Senna tora]
MSSSSSSSTSTSSASTIMTIAQAASSKTHSLFSTSGQTSSIKLDRSNFLVWESVVLPLIKGNMLVAHIDGTGAFPPELINTESVLLSNRENLTWVETQSALLTYESKIEQQNHFASLSIQPSANAAHRDESASAKKFLDKGSWRGSRGFLNRRSKETVDNTIRPLLVTLSMAKHAGVRTASNNDQINSTMLRRTVPGSKATTVLNSNAPREGITDALGQSIEPLNQTGEQVGESREFGSPISHGSGEYVRPMSQESCEAPNSTGKQSDHTSIGPHNPAQDTIQQPMVTRSWTGSLKPCLPYVGLAQSDELMNCETESKNTVEALSQPHWRSAMAHEFQALLKNKTWKLLTVFILVYVDDILITGNDSSYLKEFVRRLNSTFALKDLGSLYYFLGFEVQRDASGIYLNQSKYILDLLKKFKMADCAMAPTPMVTGRKFTSGKGKLIEDPYLYRRAMGSLQYLTNTRPDIAFAVSKLSQFLAQPTKTHFQGVKRFRYLKGTSELSLHFKPSRALTMGGCDPPFSARFMFSCVLCFLLMAWEIATRLAR